MAKRRAPRTLLELCVARAGGGFRAIRQGVRVAELVIEWAMATAQSTERDVATTVEYATFWGLTERRCWQHRADIRELFPDDEFNELVAALARSFRERGLTKPGSIEPVQEMVALAPGDLPIAV